MEAVVVLIFMIQISSAAFCSTVAAAKGYGGTAWFFGGLFFGIVALIAAAGLPMKPDLQLEIAKKSRLS
jgi:hypothetical protein